MTYAHISSRQRTGGVLLTIIGFVGIGIRWSAILSGQVPAGQAGRNDVLFPAVVVLGLALLCIPGYREERLARGEDLQDIKGSRLLTPRWWVVVVVALAAGLANFAVVAFRTPH